MEFLDERNKAVIEAAWWAGRLHHTDPKKYPKTPRVLWDNDSDKMSSNQLFSLALALASNGAEVRKKLKEQGKL